MLPYYIGPQGRLVLPNGLPPQNKEFSYLFTFIYLITYTENTYILQFTSIKGHSTFSCQGYMYLNMAEIMLCCSS